MDNDLISRQAASGCEFWDSESNFCSLYRPSAVRRGRWTTERTIEHDGEWYCSVCGYEPTVYEASNYCPNCGARMEVE